MSHVVIALIACWVCGFGTASRAETQELRIWVKNPDRGIAAALRAWEQQNPGWRVVTSLYIDGKNTQQLMTAIAGGDPPDIIQQDRFTVGEWASRGAFLSLDEHLQRSVQQEAATGEQAVRQDHFYQSCWAEAAYEGKTYAIPFSSDNRALYYNEDLLRKAGYVDARGAVVPPRNWTELREYTKRLTTYDDDGRLATLGFAPNYGNSWLYMYGWLNGGQFMSDDGRTVRLDSIEIVEALQYMVDLYDLVGGIEEVDRLVGAVSGIEFDPFATGKVAMKIDGVWVLNALAEYHPHMRFGVAPPPAPEGKASVSWSGGYSYVIPKTCKQADTAFDLIRFLVSDEGWEISNNVNRQYATSKGRGYIPAMTALPHINERLYGDTFIGDPNIPTRVSESLSVFLDLMSSAKFRPVTPVGSLLWDEHVRAINQALRADADPQETLARGNRLVQDRLDQVLSNTGGRPINWAATGVWIVGPVLLLGIAGFVWSSRRGIFSHYKADEVRAGYFFVAPWLIGFLVLTAGPIIVSLIYSFSSYDVLSPAKWSGLDNYRRMFTDDPLFWKSLLNTAYMMLGVPLGMVVSLGIAMLLNTEVRGMKLYRTIFYLPAIVPVVASSILWLWVLNPETGLVNSLLRMLGFIDLPSWLNSPSWLLGSKASIVLMGLWSAGSGMIIWLAGLKGIPRHLYEAAEIDGAGPISRFLNVTLPMLTPYILFNLVMGTIGTMQIFTQAYIMTGGGPADSTLFYAYYLFNSAFEYFDMGYASAMAWVLLLVVLALTAVQMWSAKKWVYYESA